MWNSLWIRFFKIKTFVSNSLICFLQPVRTIDGLKEQLLFSKCVIQKMWSVIVKGTEKKFVKYKKKLLLQVIGSESIKGECNG